MQIDDVVWEIINTGHCSYKVKTVDRNFCKNPYNLTGLCSKQSCPLSNSNYATVLQKKGVCYLYIKVVERVQRPKEMWEIIKLDKNYEKALSQIETHLQYWSGFITHKCKQRLTKLRQMLNRMRKLQLQGYNEYSTVSKKVERREKSREAKSLIAADLEGNIKAELLERLKKGTYGSIYNIKPNVFNQVIEQKQEQEYNEEENSQNQQFEDEIDNISDLNSEEMEDYVVDFDTDEELEEEEEEQQQEEIQNIQQKNKNKRKQNINNNQQQGGKKKAKVQIEYEDEEHYQEPLLN